MAAQYESFASKSATAGADPLVDKPTGTVDGDLLVAVAVTSGGGADPVAPAGWTQHANSVNATCPLWTKTASSEPANYSFVVGGLGGSSIVIVRYSGVLSVEAVAGVTGTGNLVIPSVTSGGANRLLAQIVTKQNNTTFTGPGSQTERFDATSSSQSYGSAGGDETVGSGATGTRTWVPASGSGNGVGYSLALVPTNIDGAASTTTETVTLSATGQVGLGGTASRTATVTTSSAGNMARSSGGARTATVGLTASGATDVAGVASLGVAAGLSASGSGGAVAVGIETVQLVGDGSTNTFSGSSQTATATRSAAGDIGTLGGGTRTATVTMSASGGVGGGGTSTTTVTLTATGRPGANGDAAETVTLTAAGNVAHNASATLAVTATRSSNGATGFGAMATLDVAATLDSGVLKTRYFTPPTQQQGMDDYFWGRYTVPVGISVLRQNGHYVTVPTPTSDECDAAGTEGTDWFRGGYLYEITSEVESALTADGYL